jgi:hypothetical protein
MEAIMEIVQDYLVSKIRDRDAVLGAIVPKILGIVRTEGQKVHGFGGRSVQLTGAIVLSASAIDAHRLMVSVYHESLSGIVKVLSLHVTDFPSAADPDFYRNQGGRVAVLSWRRGIWEDAIMADDAAPLPISGLFVERLHVNKQTSTNF